MQNRKRDTDVQNRLWNSVGEGEGGKLWENNIETGILSRVKQIISSGWMHETSVPRLGTGKTQRDGMGREVGDGDRDREHMQVHGWFMSMYGKNHYNIVKQLTSN